MTDITAAMVKELREITDAPMMDCKKALVATEGNLEKAIEHLRTSGMAKALKKSDRIASEGVVIAKASADANVGTLIEINSETDFVARDDNFKAFANKVSETVLSHKITTLESLLETKTEGLSIEETRQQLIAKIGEKISVRRLETWTTTSGALGAYVHGGRIGAMVEVEQADPLVAKEIAMHIVATRPQVIMPSEVSPALIEKEKAIFSAQALESGKPAEIVEKMIQGRINKFLDEVSLVGQPFFKDPSIKVGAYLKEKKVRVLRFVCFEVGEGIEKKVVDFAEEVKSQMQNAQRG
jgi:elongation factor Ts